MGRMHYVWMWMRGRNRQVRCATVCWAVQCDRLLVDSQSKSPFRQVHGLDWIPRYTRDVCAQAHLWFALHVHLHIINLCLADKCVSVCLFLRVWDVCGAIYSHNLCSRRANLSLARLLHSKSRSALSSSKHIKQICAPPQTLKLLCPSQSLIPFGHCSL